MYLDLASLQDFMAEVKKLKCKDVRITPVFKTASNQTIGSVVFTAASKNKIIRFEEIIGTAAPYTYVPNTEEIRKLEQSAKDYVTEVRKQATKKKLNLNSGMFKFPKELGG